MNTVLEHAAKATRVTHSIFRALCTPAAHQFGGPRDWQHRHAIAVRVMGARDARPRVYAYYGLRTRDDGKDGP